MEAPDEELPASTFTPIPLETLDWEAVHAQMRAIELKLARIKVLFAASFSSIDNLQSEICNQESPIGGS